MFIGPTFCHKSLKYFVTKPVHLAPNQHQNQFHLITSLLLKKLNNSRSISLISSSYFPFLPEKLIQLKHCRHLSYKMSSSKPILYSYFRSSASWRVRIVLEHKGIDYEYKPINLLTNEQIGEDFMKVNPMGQVPVFIYNGKTITQSMAIIEFIENVFPEKPIFPTDPFQKAKVREICEIISSGIQPLQNLGVIVKYSEDPEKRSEWANFWITKGFNALEKVLSESSGKYCVGNDLSLADCCLVPQVIAAQRFKVKMEEYPTIQRIYNELTQLESVKKAHAFVQPDCPEELRI